MICISCGQEFALPIFLWSVKEPVTAHSMSIPLLIIRDCIIVASRSCEM